MKKNIIKIVFKWMLLVILFVIFFLICVITINNQMNKDLISVIKNINQPQTYLITTNNKIDSLGRCSIYTRSGQIIPLHIQINRKQLLDTKISLKMVMLHEIGHCSFKQDHAPLMFRVDGCLKYIMSPYVNKNSASDYCYSKYKDEYLKQLQDNLFPWEF